MVKNPPANAGDIRHAGSIPGSGRPPWRAWQPTPVFLPGESPWTQEHGGLQSIGSQRVRHDWIDLTHNLVQEYLWNYKMWFLLSTNINSISIQWRNGKLDPRSLESSLLSRICRVHSDPFRTSYATSLISCFHPNTHWTHCDSLNLPYAPPKFSCLWLKCLL